MRVKNFQEDSENYRCRYRYRVFGYLSGIAVCN